MSSTINIFIKGLWENNPVIRGAIGLCPLVAVSNGVDESIVLGLLTIIVISLSMALISAFRSMIIDKTRLIFFVAVISTFTLIVELVMKAYYYEIYVKLGLYIPLIITNCVLLARAESFAYQNTIVLSLVDGFSFGVGFFLMIVFVALVRAVLGAGLIFFSMPMASFFVLALFFVVVNIVRGNK